MTDNEIWCLINDHDHKPSFGDPFPEKVHRDDTIHDLKMKIKAGESSSDVAHVDSDKLEMWKCNSLKLTGKYPIGRIEKLLSNVKFSDDKNGEIQRLPTSARVIQLKLEDDGLLLVRVPQRSMQHFLPHVPY